jgi:hypothetical protein
MALVFMGELAMGQVGYGSSFSWGELSIGQGVHETSCPWGELAWASCPCGEL